MFSSVEKSLTGWSDNRLTSEAKSSLAVKKILVSGTWIYTISCINQFQAAINDYSKLGATRRPTTVNVFPTNYTVHTKNWKFNVNLRYGQSLAAVFLQISKIAWTYTNSNVYHLSNQSPALEELNGYLHCQHEEATGALSG